MKKLVIILDGLMEKEIEKLDIKELVCGEFKDISKLDFINTCIKNEDVDSLNCIFNILGYKKGEVEFSDRAYYEALSKGIKISENSTVLRCNVVKIEKNILKDFTGGEIPENIIEILKNIEIENGKIHYLDGYKNLLIVKDIDKSILSSKCYPPHFNLGKNIEKINPENEFLKNIIQESNKIFKNYGFENLYLWPWGATRETILKKTNKKMSIISGIDLTCGMAISIGGKGIKKKGFTGDSKTDLKEKLNVALEEVSLNDLVVVHINGLDELSHKKDFNGKITFLNRIKKELIEPLIKSLLGKIDIDIEILSDHITDSFCGEHLYGEVFKLTIESRKEILNHD